MTNTITPSTSLVLQAQQIFLIRIDEANPGEWAKSSNEWLKRSALLSVTLLEVLKGSLKARPGTTATLKITQLSPISPRRPNAPGLWSKQVIEPGTEIIAFSRGSESDSLENLLVEGVCQQLLIAEGHLADVRLTIQADEENLEPSALLKLASTQAGQLGYLFTEHLWAKIAEPALNNFKIFELLMQFIELPELSFIARWLLLQSVYSEITTSPTVSSEYVHRLVVSMLRLIQVAQNVSVTDSIIQVFLPNLLGLEGGLPQKQSSEVFKSYADEHTTLEQILKNYAGNASTSALLQWLQNE